MITPEVVKPKVALGVKGDDDDPPFPVEPPPSVRTFVVRRYNVEQIPETVEWEAVNIGVKSSALCTIPILITEGIEAHRLSCTPNGDIMFERLVRFIQTPQGLAMDFRLVKIVAAGTYWDVVEVTHEFEIKGS